MPARRLQPGGGGKERKAQPGGSCGKGVRFPTGRGLRRGGSTPGLVWDAPRVPAWSPGDAGLGLAPWERGAGGAGGGASLKRIKPFPTKRLRPASPPEQGGWMKGFVLPVTRFWE